MDFRTQRKNLINLLKKQGIRNKDVLAAIDKTPRHLFVPEEEIAYAYQDRALPIGEAQTISQPLVVAEMTALVLGKQHRLHKLLEIGTGSGYQTAVLSHLADEVYTIERIECLLHIAERRFSKLNYKNIHTHCGDGKEGWEAHACYDGIIVTAATPSVPQTLLAQLCVGGCLVLPIGEPFEAQRLHQITRTAEGYETEELSVVMFVPLLPGVHNV